MRGGAGLPRSKNIGGIDAAATLYCVFPLESSAEHNKKAVQCTAVFVIRVTICEQAPIVTLTTKATLASGFLVALCARDSGGIRTHDPQLRRLLLYPTELRNHPYMHSSQMLRKSNIFFPITLHLIDNFSHKVEYSAIWAVIHLPHSQAIHPLGNDFIE